MRLYYLNGNCIKTPLILLADFIVGMLISGIILIAVSVLTVFIIAVILRRDLVCVTVERTDDKPIPEEETAIVETSLASVAELPTAVLGMELA